MDQLASLAPEQKTDSIELHVRTYRSALKSSHEVTIESLVNSHLHLNSILHPDANKPDKVDFPALIYALLRLPTCLDLTQKVILGQTPEVFANGGLPKVESWKPVTAPSRRRQMRFSIKKKILACYISSISDIDDLVNLLLAYQIEWNKLHFLLKSHPLESLATKEQLSDFYLALGKNFKLRLTRIKSRPQSLRLQCLGSSWIDYAKTTQKWWKNLAITTSPHFHISHQKIYFVSSNTHSLLNLVLSPIQKHQKSILSYIQTEKPALFSVYQKITTGQSSLPLSDFLYYSTQFLPPTSSYFQTLAARQKKLKIIPIPSQSFLDINAQIIPVSSLVSSYLDPEIKVKNSKKLQASKSLILNIDYPLGFSAYNILNETLENVAQVKGVYILGKAAVLNGEIGDLEVPRVVFDEHSQNSYLFHNCFNHEFPYINNQGSILTNQKAVSVLGTYLENQELLESYSQNNFTVIEMESGPYLSAIAEATYQERLPLNTIIDLNNAPLDIGIINYASDTPYSKASNLGVKTNLGITGAEPTYLGSRAILQRIINLESN